MSTLRSRRFGDLTYAEGSVITLTGGLVGLPQLRRWILLDMDRPLPLKWLQSLDDADFALPVASPELFLDGYSPELSAEVFERIGAKTIEDVVVMVITTVHPGGQRLTGNLAAPVLVHPVSRQGLQMILDEHKWPLRQEIDYVRFNLAVQAAGKDAAAPADKGTDLGVSKGPRVVSGEDLARQEVTL